MCAGRQRQSAKGLSIYGFVTERAAICTSPRSAPCLTKSLVMIAHISLAPVREGSRTRRSFHRARIPKGETRFDVIPANFTGPSGQWVGRDWWTISDSRFQCVAAHGANSSYGARLQKSLKRHICVPSNIQSNVPRKLHLSVSL